MISVRRLQPYFCSHTIVVLTDQPLRQVLQKPETSGRLVQWSIELGEFDIQFKPHQAMKGLVMADFLAEFTHKEQEVQPEGQWQKQTSDEPQGGWWTVFADGSTNQSTSEAGIVLISLQGDSVEYVLRFEFKATNNEIEYEAVVVDLQLCNEVGAQYMKVLSDSQLVVNQCNGDADIKSEQMKKYAALVAKLHAAITRVEFKQVPREENQQADALARLASETEGQLVPTVPIEYLESPSILGSEPSEVQVIQVNAVWTEPLIAYLRDGSLPADRVEAKKIRYRAARYLIRGSTLYKRGYTYLYLRCVSDVEGQFVLREIHEGICGNHSGGRALAFKALRVGYYWPTMRADTTQFARRCDKCQRFAHIPYQPAEPLTPLESPWPFAQWGIDIIGPFALGAGQNKFAIVVIDYFTR